MPTVKFVKEKKEITVQEGANLRNEAIKAGINLHQGINGIGAGVNKFVNCMGMGLCGTCRVNIKSGMENCSKFSATEWAAFKVHNPGAMFAYVGNEETMRLACCTRVNGDIEVETGPEMNLFGENFFS